MLWWKVESVRPYDFPGTRPCRRSTPRRRDLSCMCVNALLRYSPGYGPEPPPAEDPATCAEFASSEVEESCSKDSGSFTWPVPRAHLYVGNKILTGRGAEFWNYSHVQEENLRRVRNLYYTQEFAHIIFSGSDSLQRQGISFSN